MTTSDSGTCARRRHLTGWRRRAAALPVFALPALSVVALPVFAGTAHAATSDGLRVAAALGPGHGAGAVLLRVLLLVATAVTAGAGLAAVLRPAVAGGSRLGRLTWVAAFAVAAGSVLAHLADATTVIGTLAQTALAVAVAVLLGRRAVLVPVALLTALLAVELGSAHTGGAFLLDVGYAVAATVLAGVSLAALFERANAAEPAPVTDGEDVPAPRPAQHRVAGRFRGDPLQRIAVGAGVVLTAAGLVQLLLTGPATAPDLTGTPYGLASLAGVVLPAVATVLWLVAGRSAGRARAIELHRFAAVATVTGLAAITTLAALPTPGPGARPGEPLLRAVDLGGTQLAVLVAPMRPGPNLVHVTGTGYPAAGQVATVAAPTPTSHHGGAPTGPAGLTVGVGDRPVAVTSRPGAAGGWAVVDIPAGTTRLVLRAGPVDGVVPVVVGDEPAAADAVGAAAAGSATITGPDGPECASALLGGFVAARGSARTPMPTCPSDALTEADAIALRATIGFIGGHGVPALTLVSDDSPRARAAAGLVQDEARRRHVRVDTAPAAENALVVVSGWAGAADTVRAAARLAADAPTYLGGTFLAPWLLTPSVVTEGRSTVLPLDFSPQEAGPQQYAATLAATFPGAAPSASGYLAWISATRSTTDDRPRLYGAAAVSVPMGGPMDDMVHGSSSWFPGGTVVPVTGPLAGT